MSITSHESAAAMFADLPNRMTKREAAAALNKGQRTVERYIAEGRLRAFKVGNTILISKADLIEMVEPVRAAR